MSIFSDDRGYTILACSALVGKTCLVIQGLKPRLCMLTAKYVHIRHINYFILPKLSNMSTIHSLTTACNCLSRRRFLEPVLVTGLMVRHSVVRGLKIVLRPNVET